MDRGAETVARGGVTLGDGKRDPGVTRDRRVGARFERAREAADPAEGAEGVEAVFAPRKELPGVGLVADVPDDAVGERIEGFGKRDRELDRAERRREMATVAGNGVDDPRPQFRRGHSPESFRLRMMSVVEFWPKSSIFET